MSNAYVQKGDVLTLVAPSGGVTNGVPAIIGGLFLIPQQTAAEGTTFDAYVTGVVSLTKVGSQAWAVGADVFWDAGNARCTTDAGAGPFIGTAVVAVGAGAGETAGVVRLSGARRGGGVYHLRRRLTVAEVNAGATLLAAAAGVKYRLVDCATIAVGGAASAAFNISGTVTNPRKLIVNAAAQSTQSTLLRAGATGSVILADGASFTTNDANTAITIAKEAGDIGTATHIDVLLTYAIDA